MDTRIVVFLYMMAIVVRGEGLEEQWGRVVEVVQGSWQHFERWLVGGMDMTVAKGVLIEKVSFAWNLLKPGGAWHPKQFLEQYHGHLVLEAVLIIIIVKFMLQGSSYSGEGQKEKLTENEIDELCEEWEPEPLVPDISPFQKQWLEHTPVISSCAGHRMTVNGKSNVLDFCTTNFLGLAEEERIRAAGQATLDKYGVGSCGPRGFYGTLDVHLELENRLAAFFKTEEAILYSYDAATVPSIIPAFANAKDIVVIDDACANAVRAGCTLSRARIVTFKHNDVHDLEKTLNEITKKEKKLKKPLNRRFIAVEGIYHNTGEIAPLKEIVRIKNKHKFRLIVDESLSIGVLGATGRGAVEHCGVAPEDVDIIAGSLGHSVASIGGFCAGAREMVDHQRLSGLGYCFSASLPPFLASTSMAALDMMTQESVLAKRQSQLSMNARLCRHLLMKESQYVDVVSPEESEESPLIHVRLAPVNMDASTWDNTELLLQRIVESALTHDNMLFTVTKYSKLDASFRPPPSIKISVKSSHTEKEIRDAVACLISWVKKFKQ